MALRYSLGLGEWADKLDQAIAAVLAKGIRTKDIAGSQPANATTTADGCGDPRGAEEAGLNFLPTSTFIMPGLVPGIFFWRPRKGSPGQARRM